MLPLPELASELELVFVEVRWGLVVFDELVPAVPELAPVVVVPPVVVADWAAELTVPTPRTTAVPRAPAAPSATTP